MTEICAGVGLATACEISIDLEGLASATINDSVLAQKMQTAAGRLEQRLEVDASYQTMLSEDVGVFFLSSSRVALCWLALVKVRMGISMGITILNLISMKEPCHWRRLCYCRLVWN